MGELGKSPLPESMRMPVQSEESARVISVETKKSQELTRTSLIHRRSGFRRIYQGSPTHRDSITGIEARPIQIKSQESADGFKSQL